MDRIDPARQLPVVGMEPPEIYFLKNEYWDLLPARELEIGQRSAKAWLLDEFLVRSDEFNELRIVTMESEAAMNRILSPRKVHFHPHCHQRAEGLSPDGLPAGSTATVELLRSCGYDVEPMDTGCCGMAGTFGYEAEHYDLSMKVGELKLFPILRQMEKDKSSSTVFASGAACRMQIRHGTNIRAVHPLLLIAERLKEVDPDGKK
jgi:Fe-S oxidoreductase